MLKSSFMGLFGKRKCKCSISLRHVCFMLIGQGFELPFDLAVAQIGRDNHPNINLPISNIDPGQFYSHPSL